MCTCHRVTGYNDYPPINYRLFRAVYRPLHCSADQYGPGGAILRIALIIDERSHAFNWTTRWLPYWSLSNPSNKGNWNYRDKTWRDSLSRTASTYPPRASFIHRIGWYGYVYQETQRSRRRTKRRIKLISELIPTVWRRERTMNMQMVNLVLGTVHFLRGTTVFLKIASRVHLNTRK